MIFSKRVGMSGAPMLDAPHYTLTRSASRRRGRLAACAQDRLANAIVGAAAAEVRDAVDIGTLGLRHAREQVDRGEDLAGLAVAALRDFLVDPGLLHGVQAIAPDAFDRHDLAAGERTHRQDARARRATVDEDGAGTAETRSATEFRAGEPCVVAQVPEKRHRGIAVEAALYAVDVECDCHAGRKILPAAACDESVRRARRSVRRLGAAAS